MITNLKIREKLAVGFGVVILLSVAVGVLALYSMNTISALTYEFYGKPYQARGAMRAIGMNIYASQSTMKDVLLLRGQENLKQVEASLRDANESIQEDIQTIYKTALIERKVLDDFVLAYQAWSDINEQVLHSALASQHDQAVTLIENKGEDALVNVHQHLSQLIEMTSKVGSAFMEEAKKAHDAAFLEVIAFLCAIVVASGIISLRIARSISAPLTGIVADMKSISEGDLSAEVRLYRKDEIGALADSFRSMAANLRHKSLVADKITAGDLDHLVTVQSDADQLAMAMNKMIYSLRATKSENANQSWLMAGQAELALVMRGDQNIETLACNVIKYLAVRLACQIGTIYLSDEARENLHYGAGWAVDMSPRNAVIAFGQGLLGQAAVEKHVLVVNDAPKDYLKVASSLGDCMPTQLVIFPLLLNNETCGVIELASITPLNPLALEFIGTCQENIAIALSSAVARSRMRELLDESQRQATRLLESEARLKVQHEELQATNEELEEQTAALKDSEAKLQAQQEELQAINEELEFKTESLQAKNKEIERYGRQVDEKAKEVEQASRYKSEFLANMSHELRTPLNSLLLLAKMFADNVDGNLNEEQIESATIIFNSGNDLLNLINDILDLSKIEAGKMTLETTDVYVEDIALRLQKTFGHLAKNKGLDFSVAVAADAPLVIQGDMKRIDQILKNLTSNAIKFTSAGSVRVDVSLSSDQSSVAFAVTDTGIGIPADKQQLIFEAFKQADGSTARHYGGTGLGLSISRQLAKLMCGEVTLVSEPGLGSTFTLVLPLSSEAIDREVAVLSNSNKTLMQLAPSLLSPALTTQAEKARWLSERAVDDDREQIGANDRSILLVEDDVNFLATLLKQLRSHGLKGIAAVSGEAGYCLAEKYLPDAIILDLRLPGMSGFQLLDKLKGNPDTRHIPVHLMSAHETEGEVYRRGAIGFLQKPADKEKLANTFAYIADVIDKDVKDLLIVEDDEVVHKAIVKLIGEGDVKTTSAYSGDQAYAALVSGKFDCMILDLGLPDMSGFELIAKLSASPDIVIPPIIIYTARDLTHEEVDRLREYSQSIIIKGERSEERLLDETALFLHRVIGKLPAHKQSIIRNLYQKDTCFVGKKVLIVDDDMRNLFALAKLLKDKGMVVMKAQNGRKALEMLTADAKIDLVLMDIMMPEMDGYQTMREIRARQEYAKLPIIALTAKAMKEDRAKCIEAGASDYLSKPVDVDRLLSSLRVWLYQ